MMGRWKSHNVRWKGKTRRVRQVINQGNKGLHMKKRRASFSLVKAIEIEDWLTSWGEVLCDEQLKAIHSLLAQALGSGMSIKPLAKIFMNSTLLSWNEWKISYVSIKINISSFLLHVCSVMSNSPWPHGLYPARLFCLWDFPGKNTGVVAISSSRGSSWPRDWTWVSCTAGSFFTN